MTHPTRLNKYSVFLLGTFGFLVSLFCLLIIVFYAGSITLGSASAPQFVGNIYYSSAPLWVIGSLFGYIPLLLALSGATLKSASLSIVHVLIVILGGYGVLFIERSDSMRSEIIIWFIASVVSLLLLLIVRGANKKLVSS